MKVLHTIKLEPGTAGTTIHFRFAAPKTRLEKGLMEQIGPAYGQALRSGIPALIAQLDAVLAARDADRGPEPELIRPPDGPLSGLQPLMVVGCRSVERAERRVPQVLERVDLASSYRRSSREAARRDLASLVECWVSATRPDARVNGLKDVGANGCTDASGDYSRVVDSAPYA